MSVLLKDRSVSKAEYVNTAFKIYTLTIEYMTKLSARFGRVLQPQVVGIAADLLNHAEMANATFVYDELTRAIRLTHLCEARAALNALDVQLLVAFRVLMMNPEGGMVNSKKDPLEKSVARKKIDKTSTRLGEMLNYERALLKGVLEYTREHIPVERSVRGIHNTQLVNQVGVENYVRPSGMQGSLNCTFEDDTDNTRYDGIFLEDTPYEGPEPELPHIQKLENETLNDSVPSRLSEAVQNYDNLFQNFDESDLIGREYKAGTKDKTPESEKKDDSNANCIDSSSDSDTGAGDNIL